MPTLSVSSLSNGITPVSGALTGMLALAYSTTSYLYWDAGGNVYWQSNATTPASSTPIFTAGFAITCADFFFTYSTVAGPAFIVFLGGDSGHYAFGYVDFAGGTSLAAFTHGTAGLNAVAYSAIDQGFIIGTSLGVILKADCTVDSATTFVPDNPAITTVLTLPTTGLAGGVTLNIRSLKIDPTYVTTDFLIVCTASSNTNPITPVNVDPMNVVPDPVTYNSPSNISVLFSGALASLHKYSMTGINLWLGAFGYVETTPPTKVKNLIAMGEDMRIVYSSDGITWSTVPPDASLTNVVITSLTFNTWVYVATTLGGFVYLSTDGKNWEVAADNLLLADPANTTYATDLRTVVNA